MSEVIVLGEPIRIKSLDPTLRDEMAVLLNSYDFSKCLTCGMCTVGCIYSNLHEDQDPRKFIRKVVLGMREEAENDPFIWNCTMCNRCTVECPMGVNINALVRALEEKWRCRLVICKLLLMIIYGQVTRWVWNKVNMMIH